MFDLYHSAKQEQRKKAALDAINEEADHDTDLYYKGLNTGTKGYAPLPKHWSELPYREGYVIGTKEYYDKKYNICLEQPF